MNGWVVWHLYKLCSMKVAIAKNRRSIEYELKNLGGGVQAVIS
ncbi:hypothetical protein [Okeania sp. KiyG1]|nr:hypothetical protein [Okeania sp. KiyG1]